MHARPRVCIRIVGSGVFLPPLPTGDAIFGEDMAVGRGGRISRLPTFPMHALRPLARGSYYFFRAA